MADKSIWSEKSSKSKVTEEHDNEKLSQPDNSRHTERVKKLRVDILKITQDEFVEKMEQPISTAQLSGIELQKKPLSLKIALDIAKSFNVKLDWLYEISDERDDDATKTIVALQKIFGFQWDEESGEMSVSIDDKLNTFLLAFAEAEKTKKEKGLPELAYKYWLDSIIEEYNQALKNGVTANNVEYVLIDTKKRAEEMKTKNDGVRKIEVSTGGHHN